MKGAGVGGTMAKSSGAFSFIWTLIALGVTALFSVILSARGLWEHLSRRTVAQHKQAARAHEALLADLPGPIRDCGQMTSKPEANFRWPTIRK
jgi:hypothetical protein